MTRTMRMFPALLVIAFAALQARAVELTTLKTRHYEIHHNIDPDRAVEIGLHMDRVYDEYDRRMRSFPGKRGAAAPLYVFQTDQQYTEFLAAKGIDATGSGGMFFRIGAETGLATFLGDNDPDRVRVVLQHEGFHQFANMKIGDTLPTWANEGLAEYFGRGRIENGKFVTGYASDDDVRVLRLRVRENTLTSVEDLVNTSSETWSARVRAGAGAAQYLESWALVQFLVHSGNGRYQPYFLQFMKDLARGVDADTAFKNAFKIKTYDPVEPKFREFIDRELRQGLPPK